MADNLPTGRELEALKVLWVRGKATVREIYDEMRPQEGDGELAYTTVLSLLQTMEQKELVGHELSGKAYIYRPLVQRENTLRILAGGFLDQVFDGGLAEYVARALQSRKHTLQELEEVVRLIGEAKKKARTVGKVGSGGGR